MGTPIFKTAAPDWLILITGVLALERKTGNITRREVNSK